MSGGSYHACHVLHEQIRMARVTESVVGTDDRAAVIHHAFVRIDPAVIAETFIRLVGVGRNAHHSVRRIAFGHLGKGMRQFMDNVFWKSSALLGSNTATFTLTPETVVEIPSMDLAPRITSPTMST
mgnify:CR=1 FL=1